MNIRTNAGGDAINRVPLFHGMWCCHQIGKNIPLAWQCWWGFGYFLIGNHAFLHGERKFSYFCHIIIEKIGSESRMQK